MSCRTRKRPFYPLWDRSNFKLQFWTLYRLLCLNFDRCRINVCLWQKYTPFSGFGVLFHNKSDWERSMISMFWQLIEKKNCNCMIWAVLFTFNCCLLVFTFYDKRSVPVRIFTPHLVFCFVAFDSVISWNPLISSSGSLAKRVLLGVSGARNTGSSDSFKSANPCCV